MTSIKQKTEALLADEEARLRRWLSEVAEARRDLDETEAKALAEIRELDTLRQSMGMEPTGLLAPEPPVQLSEAESEEIEEPEEPPEPPEVPEKVSGEDLRKTIRDWLTKNKSADFTSPELAEILGIGRPRLRPYLKEALDRQWIETVDETRSKGGMGRPAQVYRYKRHVDDPAMRVKRDLPPPELEAVRQTQKNGKSTLPSSARARKVTKRASKRNRIRTQSKPLNDILRRCEDLGCSVQRRGNQHIAVVRPDGSYVTMSQTPSSDSTDKVIAELKQNGIDVKAGIIGPNNNPKAHRMAR